MTDHLNEALRRYDASDYARQRSGQSDSDLGELLMLAALQESAQAHVLATLEVGEHVENLWDQVRRLADGVEALVDVVREQLGIRRAFDSEPVGDGPRLDPRPLVEPSSTSLADRLGGQR